MLVIADRDDELVLHGRELPRSGSRGDGFHGSWWRHYLEGLLLPVRRFLSRLAPDSTVARGLIEHLGTVPEALRTLLLHEHVEVSIDDALRDARDLDDLGNAHRASLQEQRMNRFSRLLGTRRDGPPRALFPNLADFARPARDLLLSSTLLFSTADRAAEPAVIRSVIVDVVCAPAQSNCRV